MPSETECAPLDAIARYLSSSRASIPLAHKMLETLRELWDNPIVQRDEDFVLACQTRFPASFLDQAREGPLRSLPWPPRADANRPSTQPPAVTRGTDSKRRGSPVVSRKKHPRIIQVEHEEDEVGDKDAEEKSVDDDDETFRRGKGVQRGRATKTTRRATAKGKSKATEVTKPPPRTPVKRPSTRSKTMQAAAPVASTSSKRPSTPPEESPATKMPRFDVSPPSGTSTGHAPQSPPLVEDPTLQRMISQEARLASDEERVAAVEGKLRGYEVEDAVGNRILDALKEELTMMQRGWEEIRQGVLDLRSELCKPADQSSLATFWQEFIQVRDRVLPYVMRAEEEELAARKSAADTEKVAGSLQTREADGEQGTHRVDSDERGALETHAGGEQRNVGPMQILNDPSTESARIWRAWE